MRPRLVALDLDGTLLPRPRCVPEGHRDLLRWLAEVGIPVCIVTGRPLLTARWAWQELGLVTPLVCFNGVWVGHPEGEAWHHRPLPEAAVQAVLAALREFPGMRCCYPRPDSWLVDGFTTYTADWQERYRVAIHPDPDAFGAWQGPSCKVMFVAEPVVIQAVEVALRRRFAGKLHVVVSEPDRIEIHDLLATKAWGLARLAEAMQLVPEQVWAVGDADNDLEMLRWAGRGFAMPHASERLRAVADAQLAAHEAPLLALRELIAAEC